MNLKSTIIIAFMLITILPFLPSNTALANDASDVQSPRVYLEKNTIVYDGPLTEEGVKTAKNLYSPIICRLVINSSGGEINIGMTLGEWVYDKRLDVEVRNIAFSSAANYVFTAGKNKYLHRDSMLGWHGGATQDNGDMVMDSVMKKYLADSIARETAFFAKISVNQKSTVYGLNTEFEQYSEENGFVGWTYSLEAMEKMGIKNIYLLDGEWTPANEYNTKKIFTINVDDIVLNE